MPPQRGSTKEFEVKDKLVLDHLAGETDLFADPAKALMLDGVLKETLAQVQKTSKYFHGFTDAEIDIMFPFLTHFPFNHGDQLAQAGEDASWVAVLLTGRLHAVDGNKDVLIDLQPGAIVGEMALFRGGTRYCDIVGRGTGALAALLFDDIPRMLSEAPAVTLKLIAAFGRAASSKFVQPQPLPAALKGASPAAAAASSALTAPPAASPSKRAIRRNDSSELSLRHRVLVQSLQKRGLTDVEAGELLKWLVIDEFAPNAQLLQEGRTLAHVIFVIGGAVLEGENQRGVGEIAGSWAALSGHPITQRVVGGKEGGQVGYLSLATIEEIATTVSGSLALKIVKLIGISATASKEQDGMASLSSQLGSKLTEVLYRNKMKSVEAMAEIHTEERDRAVHDKNRNEILMKKLQRAHDALTQRLGSMETIIAQKDKEKQRLELTIKQKDKEAEALRTRNDSLVMELQSANDEAQQMMHMSRLREANEAKAREIEDLKERLELANKEAEFVEQEAETRYRKLQEDSLALHTSTQARNRLRMFILLIVLDRKRRFERKARVKAGVLTWLSGKQSTDDSITIDTLSMELQSAKQKVDAIGEESDALREAAVTLATSKSTLEAQQAELIETAKRALGRDGQLEGAAAAADERAAAATKKTQALVNENLHLRWAVSQAEERFKETAMECASLVADRDSLLGELHQVRELEQQASDGLRQAKKHILELEASILAERSTWATRVSEAERASREHASAVHRARRLQEELDMALGARAAESLAHEKQRVLLARLLELEGTFAPMLQPQTSGSFLTPYSQALQEIAKEEMRIPHAIRERKTPASGLSPPLLAGPLPGSEARNAAYAAVAATEAERAANDPSAVRGVDVARTGAMPRSLPGSTSLPLLRTGLAASHGAKPLPVARGSTRVVARKSGGVSLGSRNSLQQLAALQSRPSL